MAPLRRTTHSAFRPAEVAAAKGDHRVAVCLPARNEADTVGAIVEAIHHELVERVDLVDDLVVVDDHSSDATAAVARSAGARIVDAAATLADLAPGPGKGAALWRSLHETDADLVVWIDADITPFGVHFVTGLVGALLERPDVAFVKGAYRRPLGDADDDATREGGRVTELLARPALANFFPDISQFSQPLSGEYGGRRHLLERLSFVHGYGVDVALLIDVARTVGLAAMTEVDLGERQHRNRPLSQLGPQATEVLRSVLVRAGVAAPEPPVVLRRPDQEPLLVAHRELPPVVGLPGYDRRSA